jgi:hypothetical protein
MIDVPQEVFDRIGERQPCGFNFRYNPKDADYGVGITTDEVIPQLTSFEEALRVGKALQEAIFGKPVVQKTLIYYS